MRYLNVRSAIITVVVAGLALLLQTPAAASSSLESRILAMIPEGAELVASLTAGPQASYLVMTVNNKTDLTDFQSITGADPLRAIGRVVLVTTSSPRGPQFEHSLLAIGQFDFGHIAKSALENGAASGDFRGLPVLVFPPLERNRGVSQDVRWLTVIDSKILVFGSIVLVEQELDRYLDAAQPDSRFMWRLSRLRHEDQSWCVVSSLVRRNERVRRSLASLDMRLVDPEHENDGLVLGMRFGRNVEIEFESEPDPVDPREIATQSGRVDDLGTRLVSPRYEFRNANDTDYHVLKMSRKAYDAWIATQGSTGGPPPHESPLMRRNQPPGETTADLGDEPRQKADSNSRKRRSSSH